MIIIMIIIIIAIMIIRIITIEWSSRITLQYKVPLSTGSC